MLCYYLWNIKFLEWVLLMFYLKVKIIVVYDMKLEWFLKKVVGNFIKDFGCISILIILRVL